MIIMAGRKQEGEERGTVLGGWRDLGKNILWKEIRSNRKGTGKEDVMEEMRLQRRKGGVRKEEYS